MLCECTHVRMNVCFSVCVNGLRVTGIGFSICMAEAGLYFRQVLPLFCSTFSHSLELAWIRHILDIYLVLSVRLYKSEDTVYTHALTGGLGFSPRREGFMHFGVVQSFLLSALAGRSCVVAVDPPWPCYERERRERERWKTEESGYSQVKVFEA